MRAPIAGWLAAAVLAAAPLRAQQSAPPASAADAPPPDSPGRAVFLRACASCHGQDGSGTGTVALDRPARSFKDGGFSFGNTPEALLRTIGTGIPGTPMPGFTGALADADLRAVAAYVAALGPPATPLEARDAVLAVTDLPLVVRGILPPIAPDLPLRPRGVLIGSLDGLTFEYRTDDVRLLGVFEGGFVERTDWTGRGGTPLQPLGQLVHLEHGGDPPAQFFALAAEAAAGDSGDAGEPDALAGSVPLACHFTGTWIDPPLAGLDYELRLADGTAIARVRESAQAVHSLAGAGFLRTFSVTFKLRDAPAIALQADDVAPDARVEHFSAETQAPTLPKGETSFHPARPTHLWVARRPEGGFVCTGVRDLSPSSPKATAPTADIRETAHGVLLIVPQPTRGGGPTAVLRVITVLASQWSDEVRAALEKDLPP